MPCYLFIPAYLVSCGVQIILVDVFCDVFVRVLKGNIVFSVYVLLTFIQMKPRMYDSAGNRDVLVPAAFDKQPNLTQCKHVSRCQ
jgi:hypothetical protein